MSEAMDLKARRAALATARDKALESQDTGDVAALRAALDGATEKERRSLRRTLSPTLLWEAEGPTPRACLALMALGDWKSLSDVLWAWFRDPHEEQAPQEVERVIADLVGASAQRDQAWFEEVVSALGEQLVGRTHALLQAMVAQRDPGPAALAYLRGLLAMSDPWSSQGTAEARADRVTAYIQEHQVLEVDLWRFFTLEGGGSASMWSGHRDAWILALTRMAQADPELRARLLDASLAAQLRDFPPTAVTWYPHLHRALEPTPSEVIRHLDQYIQMLGAGPSVSVSLALEMLTSALPQVAQGPGVSEVLVTAVAGVLGRSEKKLLKAALMVLRDLASTGDAAQSQVADQVRPVAGELPAQLERLVETILGESPTDQGAAAAQCTTGSGAGGAQPGEAVAQAPWPQATAWTGVPRPRTGGLTPLSGPERQALNEQTYRALVEDQLGPDAAEDLVASAPAVRDIVVGPTFSTFALAMQPLRLALRKAASGQDPLGLVAPIEHVDRAWQARRRSLRDRTPGALELVPRWEPVGEGQSATLVAQALKVSHLAGRESLSAAEACDFRFSDASAAWVVFALRENPDTLAVLARFVAWASVQTTRARGVSVLLEAIGATRYEVSAPEYMVLALFLSAKSVDHRAGAAEAVAGLCASGLFSPERFVEQALPLCENRLVKAARFAPALGDAAAISAIAAWRVLEVCEGLLEAAASTPQGVRLVELAAQLSAELGRPVAVPRRLRGRSRSSAMGAAVHRLEMVVDAPTDLAHEAARQAQAALETQA